MALLYWMYGYGALTHKRDLLTMRAIFVMALQPSMRAWFSWTKVYLQTVQCHLLPPAIYASAYVFFCFLCACQTISINVSLKNTICFLFTSGNPIDGEKFKLLRTACEHK